MKDCKVLAAPSDLLQSERHWRSEGKRKVETRRQQTFLPPKTVEPLPTGTTHHTPHARLDSTAPDIFPGIYNENRLVTSRYFCIAPRLTMTPTPTESHMNALVRIDTSSPKHHKITSINEIRSSGALIISSQGSPRLSGSLLRMPEKLCEGGRRRAKTPQRMDS